MVGSRRVSLASVVAAGLIAVTVTIAAGCFLDWEPPPRPVSNWTIEDARAFSDVPLYWLGESYEGLPLTYVGGSTDGDGVKHASFWYGEPKYSGDRASGSWIPPLEIDVQPYCGFAPKEFLSYQDDDYGIESEVISVQIRGVDGYLERYSSKAASLFLWAGLSTIHLYASQTELDIERAAQELIPIAEGTGATLKRLPAPITTSC